MDVPSQPFKSSESLIQLQNSLNVTITQALHSDHDYQRFLHFNDSTMDFPELPTLTDLLTTFGNPVSCPFCSIPLAKGTTARVCLTCGKSLGPLFAGTEHRWRGSVAEMLLQKTLDPNYSPQLCQSADGESEAVEVSHGALLTPTGFSAELDDDFFAAKPMSKAVSSEDSAEYSAKFETHAPVNDLHMFATKSTNSSPIQRPVSHEASDMDSFFNQLSGLETLVPNASSTQQLEGSKTELEILNPAVQQILDGLPDLTFMLSDKLVIPQTVLQIEQVVKYEASQGKKNEALQVEATVDEVISDDDWGDYNS